MNNALAHSNNGVASLFAAGVGLSGIKLIKSTPDTPLDDYQAVMKLADIEAQQDHNEVILIS